MHGFDGIVSIEVKGGLKKARHMLERCHLFTLAKWLGAVERLIKHSVGMTNASVSAAGCKLLAVGDGLVRLSVRVEVVGDLCDELQTTLT